MNIGLLSPGCVTSGTRHSSQIESLIVLMALESCESTERIDLITFTYSNGREVWLALLMSSAFWHSMCNALSILILSVADSQVNRTTNDTPSLIPYTPLGSSHHAP